MLADWNPESPVWAVSEFNLVVEDENIVELVLGQFSGVSNRKCLEFNFKVQKAVEQYERKNAKAIKLTNYLKNLPKGKHSKRSIREAVGLDTSHFAVYLAYEKIVQLVQDGVIKIEYRHILKF